MIQPEVLTKQVKIIAQDAWRVETNTTLNAIVEHIVREALLTVILPELESLENRLGPVDLETKNEPATFSLEEIMAAFHKGTPNDASKDGGLSQPEGDSQTSNESSRQSPRTRKPNSANV